MSESFNLHQLQEAVKSAAAFRSRSKLQPAGGAGDKVFPPTYSGAVYAMEMRCVEGNSEPVRCVLLDSVQSQANRAEEALQDAVDDGRIKIPVVEVDFSDIPIVEPGSNEPGLFEPIGRVTSLEAPHRIADAILRDSELGGKPFRATDEGKKIIMATLRNATPLYELCPTALVYGIWDSTGPKGGLGVKFQRAIVSEIIGVDASLGVKTSSRMDPLGIKASATIYARDNSDGGLDWTPDAEEESVVRDKGGKAILYNRSGSAQGTPGNPSKANHSNIPPQLSKLGDDPLGEKGQKVYLAGGVTIKYAEQTTVLSLPALRRLKFPLASGLKSDPEVNLAAQTVLAALGLCGAVLASERGLDLRSRCLLYATEKPQWELLRGDGEPPKTFELTASQAIKLLADAIDAAKSKKLPWRDQALVLKPATKLVDLVRKSQELAVKSSGDDGVEA
jgi:CRISPR-associated protein Csb1